MILTLLIFLGYLCKCDRPRMDWFLDSNQNIASMHQSFEDYISNMVFLLLSLCYLSISWAKPTTSTITGI